MSSRPLAALMLSSTLLLGACAGPLTGVMLAGNIVNAAGSAAVDAAGPARRDPTAEAERARGMIEHLARVSAERGDPEAAYLLANLLTEREDARALYWMCQAARAGHGPAQLQVGHWYNRDREREDLWPFITVNPDDGIAWYWYSQAAGNGQRLARIFRDALGTEAEARATLVANTEGGPECGGSNRFTGPRETLARGDVLLR